MWRLQMILLLVAVGKQVYRENMTMDENKCTCEDLAHLCNAVTQVYGIPMDVDPSGWVLVGVSDPLLYIVQESDLPVTLVIE